MGFRKQVGILGLAFRITKDVPLLRFGSSAERGQAFEVMLLSLFFPGRVGFRTAILSESMINFRCQFGGDVARAAEVASVLVKYGLAGWLTHLSLSSIFYSNSGQIEPISN